MFQICFKALWEIPFFFRCLFFLRMLWSVIKTSKDRCGQDIDHMVANQTGIVVKQFLERSDLSSDSMIREKVER